MAEFFRNNKELIFWLAGIIIFAVIAVYLTFTITFLSGKAKDALGNSLNPGEEIIKFNLEKARQIED